MKQGKDILEVVETIDQTVGDTKSTDIPTELKGKSLVEMCVANFTYASDGRAELAKEITGKGVTTNAKDSLKTMAGNVKKIKVGYGSGETIPLDKVNIHYTNTYSSSYTPEVLPFSISDYTGLRLYTDKIYRYGANAIDVYDEATKKSRVLTSDYSIVVDVDPHGDASSNNFVYFTMDGYYTVVMYNKDGVELGRRKVEHLYDYSLMHINMFYAYRDNTDIYLIVQASYGNNGKPAYVEKFSSTGAFIKEYELLSHESNMNAFTFACDSIFLYRYDWRNGDIVVYWKSSIEQYGEYTSGLDRENEKFFQYNGYVINSRNRPVKMRKITNDETFTFPEITGTVTGVSPIYGEDSFYLTTSNKTYKIKRVDGAYVKELEVVTIEHTPGRPISGRTDRFCMAQRDAVYMYNRGTERTVSSVTVK